MKRWVTILLASGTLALLLGCAWKASTVDYGMNYEPNTILTAADRGCEATRR
jgi:hypothetical protein